MKRIFLFFLMFLGIICMSQGSQKGETSRPIYGHKYTYE